METKISKCVVADSSFYCCYDSDIKKREFLLNCLRIYQFFIGNKIRSELPPALTDSTEFLNSVGIIEENFFELIRPFFNRSNKHKDDGEYEAIGIAYYINENFDLKYLIIDDIIAYKFTVRHFPILAQKMTRTIGFVKKCCYEDKAISPDLAIEILEAMRQSFQNMQSQSDLKRRPCSLDQNIHDKILIPLISQIKEDYKYGRI
jgi:plasmid maintenance system antidote protein VapI